MIKNYCMCYLIVNRDDYKFNKSYNRWFYIYRAVWWKISIYQNSQNWLLFIKYMLPNNSQYLIGFPLGALSSYGCFWRRVFYYNTKQYRKHACYLLATCQNTKHFLINKKYHQLGMKTHVKYLIWLYDIYPVLYIVRNCNSALQIR